MIVMKFGGTSVAGAGRLRGMADIVAARAARRPLVVVSALAGVTGLLDEAARLAAGRREPEAEERLAEIGRRHAEALGAIENAERRAEAASRSAVLLDEARLMLRGLGILGELTPRSLDAILSTGERVSALIAEAVLRERGLPARLFDARGLLVTDDRHGAASPLAGPTGERCATTLRPAIEAGELPVIGGFIGATGEGVTSTLGRGGSDLTASFLGALLGAEEIQIWTDVDGMMTADPRLVPTARPLPAVSFDEAAELATFGAKVLHPATIHPALEREIPVRVLNTMRPELEGTLIRREAPGSGEAVTAIACKAGLTVVTVASTRMLLAHGFLSRIFEVFDRAETSVDLVATSEVSVSLTLDDPRHIGRIRDELSGFSRVMVEDRMAIVCLVGRGLPRRSGIAARAFDALREINVRMISLGASEINLSLVVAEPDAPAAVRSLHHAFFGC